MFTKTLQDVFYYNIGKVESGTKTFYGAPVYKQYSTQISDMVYLDNTTKGEQQNLIGAAREALPLRPLPHGLLRLHERQGRVRGNVQRRVLELAVPDDGRQHLQPGAHALLLGRPEPVQHRRVPGVPDRPAGPQHRPHLHGPVGSAVLDPHGRQREQRRRLGQRPPLRARELQRHRVEGHGGSDRSRVERLPGDDGPRRLPRPRRGAQRARRPVDPHARLPLRRDAADLRRSRCSSRSTS